MKGSIRAAERIRQERKSAQKERAKEKSARGIAERHGKKEGAHGLNHQASCAPFGITPLLL